jgi:hypothetical protein
MVIESEKNGIVVGLIFLSGIMHIEKMYFLGYFIFIIFCGFTYIYFILWSKSEYYFIV